MLPLVALLAFPQPVDLSWKFTKGDTFYVTHEVFNLTEIDAGKGFEPILFTAFESVYQVSVTSADAKKTVLTLRFESVRHGATDMFPLIQMRPAEEVEGQTVTVTLDAARRVTAVDGGKPAQGDDELTDEGLLTELTVRQHAAVLLRVIPGKRVTNGSWTAERRDELPNEIAHEQTERGKVGESENGLLHLSAEVDGKWTFGGERKGAKEMVGKEGSRLVRFDANAGRVRTMKEKVMMTGEYEYKPQGLSAALVGGGPRKVRGKVVTWLTLTDDKPKAKK